MHDKYESPEQLKHDRDYWKHRFIEYRKDVEFFVGLSILLFIIIVVEYIIAHYIEVPIK